MFPVLNHIFDLPIWKIHADTQEANLLIELRDATNRSLSFYRLCLPEFRIERLQAIDETAWWNGLYSYRKGIAWIYHYPDPDRPEPAGIRAWDTLNDSILWEDPSGRLLGFGQKEQLFDMLMGTEIVYRVRNPRLGNILEQLREAPTMHQLEKANTVLHLPQRYPPGHLYHKQTCQFLYKKLNIQTSFPVDYVEVADKIVISYFLKKNSRINNYLLILDKSAHVHMHKCIQNGLDSPVSDTFFVYERNLFFKAESNKIIAHNL